MKERILHDSIYVKISRTVKQHRNQKICGCLWLGVEAGFTAKALEEILGGDEK